MKQTVTVIYEDTMGVAMNVLQLEGTTLPEGIMPMNYAKDVFMAKFAGWRKVYDDGHVMVFEKES